MKTFGAIKHECGCTSNKGIYITKCRQAMLITTEADIWRNEQDGRAFEYWIKMLLEHIKQ